MLLLATSYNPWLVAISILIASFASYVALDLAQRVRHNTRELALSWGIGGSITLGSGIWAMHFVGMMAFSLPIEIGYGYGLTALSWLAAVAVSGVALTLASRGELNARRLALGSLTMGAGICAMHYIGMAALDITPGIRWNAWLIAASALIAVVASAVALLIFFQLRRVAGGKSPRLQLAAALVMGLAISGMHYTGMAAASFPLGSVCGSIYALSGGGLGGIVILASVLLLVLTLFTSALDDRLRDRTTRLATSLQLANSELTSANSTLQQLAFRDPLTELPNRLLFEERLQQAVTRIDEEPARRRLAVLFIDLDGFKPINDSLGHAQGDVLLRDAAQRLARLAGAGDTLARVGGDEFVLVLESSAGPEACTQVARRIIDTLSQPFEMAEQRFSISASVGIVMYPDDGAAEQLLARADAAMYAAKRSGGASHAFYRPHMDAGALEQLNLQTDLRHAIEHGELQLHYQPKLGQDGAVCGVEALLRWPHAERGWVSPAQFIPVAERFGLINKLGNWVIDEACRQMGAWAARGQRQRVAINVSVHQLRQNDLAARIEAALARHQLDAADLLCEITESAAMHDLRSSRHAFAKLLDIGVYLSIDDFGTGYSSLSYLRQLPARQLKIDRSFIKDLEVSADACAVVKAVLSVAHALNLRVVAEGVETAGQRDILSAMGCDEFQGYFFARPMPAEALLEWLEQCPAPASAQCVAHEVEPVLAEKQLLADEKTRRTEHTA